MTGTIFDVKELGVHDGPGLRTTVFLKGCPLRCLWCHNPEGLEKAPQLSIRQNACRHCGLCEKPCSHEECKPYKRCLHICPQGLISVCGEVIEADALAKRLLRNSRFWGESGGVTFSGGEPLLQAEFVLAVLDELEQSAWGGAPENGKAQAASGKILAAVETSGYADGQTFLSVISRMSLVYMDIKLADEAMHKKYTGVSNARILGNLEILRASGIPCVIRTPLIPGITDTVENLRAIERLTAGLAWERLPYNAMAGAKYEQFGMKYALE